MNTPQFVYTLLANPFAVSVLLFFVNQDRYRLARFVWNLIDHMAYPDYYWDVLAHRHLLVRNPTPQQINGIVWR